MEKSVETAEATKTAPVNENIEAVEELPPEEKKSTFLHFAAMSGTFWIASCFTSYQTVFLQSIGWNTAQVGVLQSINHIVGIFSSPTWGTISDKIRSVKKVLLLVLTISMITYFATPWLSFSIWGVSFLYVVIPFTNFFRMPLNSLIDNWTVRTSNKHNLNFGQIRSVGSFTFGVTGMLLGFFVTYINEHYSVGRWDGNFGTVLTFICYSVFNLALFAVVLSTPERNAQGTGKKRLKFSEMPYGKLFRNYYYVTYIIYAIVLQLPMSCLNGFTPYLLAEVGSTGAAIGYVTGFKAFIEIPMLMSLKKFRSKVPLYYLLLASGCFYVLEAILYSNAQNFWHVFITAAICQGLGGGLSIAAGTNYVYTLSPPELKATAQTLHGACVNVAGIVGSAMGGFLIHTIGIREFYRYMGVLILVALGLYVLSFVFGPKISKQPRPGITP